MNWPSPRRRPAPRPERRARPPARVGATAAFMSIPFTRPAWSRSSIENASNRALADEVRPGASPSRPLPGRHRTDAGHRPMPSSLTRSVRSDERLSLARLLTQRVVRGCRRDWTPPGAADRLRHGTSRAGVPPVLAESRAVLGRLDAARRRALARRLQALSSLERNRVSASGRRVRCRCAAPPTRRSGRRTTRERRFRAWWWLSGDEGLCGHPSTPLSPGPYLAFRLRLRTDGSPGREALPERPQRKSLFDSMSNHMANRVNCEPNVSSSATSTTVATETSFPRILSTVSAIPRPRPTRVIKNPSA
jgi:hypothetical protein